MTHGVKMKNFGIGIGHDQAVGGTLEFIRKHVKESGGVNMPVMKLIAFLDSLEPKLDEDE